MTDPGCIFFQKDCEDDKKGINKKMMLNFRMRIVDQFVTGGKGNKPSINFINKLFVYRFGDNISFLN